MNNVLVTHPLQQYSHQLAIALYEQNRLAAYWTGIPTHPRPKPPLLGPALARKSQYDFVPLPPERVRHCYIAPVVNQIARTFASPPLKVTLIHRAQAWFDRWCAQRFDSISSAAVVCYENAALETFQRAQEQGVVTILDAASFHHTWQDRFSPPIELPKAHERITNRKNKEIELADHILTVSELARASYVNAGIQPDRVTAVPLGCDTQRFRPRPGPSRSQPMTFIFAGRADTRKGFDILLSAVRVLQRERLSFRVLVAGPFSENRSVGDLPIKILGRVTQSDLARFYQQADVLVLPSRHDSFGMVVPEAMSSGLAVIVSDHVGAKSLIDEAVTGWIFPAEDADALADRMREALNDRDRIFQMGRKAAIAAEDYTWDAYRHRVATVLSRVITGSASVARSG